MSIGSIASMGSGFAAQNMRINSTSTDLDTAKLRKQLSTPTKPTGAGESGDAAGTDKEVKAGASSSPKASNSSSTASSEASDYSSMTIVDLTKLAAKGDKEAKEELEKRDAKAKLLKGEPSDSGQNGTTVGARVDIVA